MFKKYLALASLIIAVSVATMAECDKLDLQHAPKELLVGAVIFFLAIFLSYYLFTTLANKNKENETASFFFLVMGIISEIVGIGVAIYLSAKYIEFAVLSAFVVSLVSIDILLSKEDTNID